MPIVPTRPPILPGPFAYNGDKNTIPDTGADAGAASWSSGFPPITQLPLTAGGIPPQRNDFNGVLNAYGVLLSFIQTGAYFEWSDELTYPFPCRVLGSNGTLYEWVSASGVEVEAGAHDPTTDTDGIYWKTVGNGGTTVPTGAVMPFYNVKLGGTENRNPVFWGETEADTSWLICDGGSDGRGGTVPDLREKFIMGANGTKDAGETGGAASATPTVIVTDSASQISIGATTLSVAQLASHSHTVTTTQYPASGDFGTGSNKATVQTNSGMTGGSQAHTHSATLDKLSLSATASDVPTLPPFYRLVHCVKLPAS